MEPSPRARQFHRTLTASRQAWRVLSVMWSALVLISLAAWTVASQPHFGPETIGDQALPPPSASVSVSGSMPGSLVTPGSTSSVLALGAPTVRTRVVRPTRQAAATPASVAPRPATVHPVAPTAAPTAAPPATTRTPAAAPVSRGDRIVALAKSYIGVPYLWGGETTAGMDCSGLVYAVLTRMGLAPPRTSAEQADWTVRITAAQAAPGDLVFFYTPVSHVGIYIGGGLMIDSEQPGTLVAIRPVPDGGVYGRVP